MWDHPARRQRRDPAPRGAVVLEPAIGRLTGTDTGKGPPARAGEIAQLTELLLGPPDALPPDLVDGTFSSPPAHSRAHRSGAVPRKRVVRAAGIRARDGRRGPRASEVTLVAAKHRLSRSGRHNCRASEHDRRDARRGAQGRLPTADIVVMAQRSPTSGPRPSDLQDQEVGYRSGARSADQETPTFSPNWSPAGAQGRSWSASPPRPATARARC